MLSLRSRIQHHLNCGVKIFFYGMHQWSATTTTTKDDDYKKTSGITGMPKGVQEWIVYPIGGQETGEKK